MFTVAGVVIAVATVWLAIGFGLSIVMGRRGHNGFGWMVMGSLLGPLAVVMAIYSGRNGEDAAPMDISGGTGRAGPGPVDVLVGYDGSPEAAAVVATVLDLFGTRLGRLTVAIVVPFDDVRGEEQQAKGKLRRLAERTPGGIPELLVLHGHPSAALHQRAVESGYELIAVGTRGAGLSKTVVGSAASELARDSKVPVLLVGGQP